MFHLSRVDQGGIVVRQVGQIAQTVEHGQLGGRDGRRRHGVQIAGTEESFEGHVMVLMVVHHATAFMTTQPRSLAESETTTNEK